MIKYIFTINGVGYDITPIGDISLRLEKPDEVFYNAYPSDFSIKVHDHKFKNVGIEDFSSLIKTVNKAYIEIYNNGVSWNKFYFNSRNIKYDDFKGIFEITASNIAKINDYQDTKDDEIDILDYTITQTTLYASNFLYDSETSTYSTGQIKGCIKIFDCFKCLVQNKIFGTEFTLSSVFLSKCNIYITQASNVIAARESTSYIKSGSFPNFTFGKLIDDFVAKYNLKIIVDFTKSTVRIEPFETFENEKQTGINCTTNQYYGYIKNQKEYSFKDDIIKSEKFIENNADYTSTYFKTIKIEYEDNDNGEEKTYTMNGYCDLQGFLSNPDEYSENMWFYIISSDGINVTETEYVYGTENIELDYTYSLMSGQKYDDSAFTDNGILKIDSTYTNDYTDFIIKTDKFIVEEGNIILFNMPFKFYFDTSFNNSLALKFEIFVIDYQKYEDNYKSIDSYLISNKSRLYANFLRTEELEYYSPTYSQQQSGTDFIPSTVTINREYTNFLTLEKTSTGLNKTVRFQGETYNYISRTGYASLGINESCNNAAIILRVKFATYPSNTLPKFISFDLNQSFRGQYSVLNGAMAFQDTVPTYQLSERYEERGKINGTDYSFNQRRIKEGKTILPIKEIDDFDYSGLITTQFGLGEIENAEIDLRKRLVTITGLYSKSLTKSSECSLISFYFPGLKTITIIDNLVVIETYPGVVLSEINPTITISKYATISYQPTEWNENNKLIIQSEDGTVSNVYEVLISISYPKFYYKSTLTVFTIHPSINSYYQWILSNGTTKLGYNWSSHLYGQSGYCLLKSNHISEITYCEIQGANSLIDFTGFDSLVDVTLYCNNNEISLNLPDNKFNSISLSSCIFVSSFSLSNFTDLSGLNISLGSVSGININTLLMELDSNDNWINGKFTAQNSGEITEIGEINKTSLESKGWEVTII